LRLPTDSAIALVTDRCTYWRRMGRSPSRRMFAAADSAVPWYSSAGGVPGSRTIRPGTLCP
jgi:hypothetical protein